MIFCPRTYIYPPTVEALNATGAPWIPVELGPAYSYVDYWRERWAEGVTFTSVEHDTIISRANIEELDACPQEWCCAATADCVDWSVNVARFRASFIAAYPTLWEGYWTQRLVGEVPLPVRMDPDWNFCDTWLLSRTGTVPHVHYDYPVVNARPAGAAHDVSPAIGTQLVLDGMAGIGRLVRVDGPACLADGMLGR